MEPAFIRKVYTGNWKMMMMKGFRLVLANRRETAEEPRKP